MKNIKKIALPVAIVLVAVVLLRVAASSVTGMEMAHGGIKGPSISSNVTSLSGGLGGIMPSFSPSVSMDAATSMGSTIGFSVGGAKDINNFRENIENGYFPISTDITINGLFYDYYFETGNSGQASDELFSPAYSVALSRDPISNKLEYYITVGLNSNIKESDFTRKKLNLVVALDISGSMSSGFNGYYYDNPMKYEEEYKRKMQVANESLNILVDQLKDDDRFGLVLFESNATTMKKLELLEETNVERLKERILQIQETGGTNMEAGYKEATGLLDEFKDVDSDEYENRIIVITDAMPNTGRTDRESLIGMIENNADDGIYTTFIGVGIDFNTELIQTISDVRGANYYSVHSSKEFKERMGEQFEYMVTPLVFDLELELDSDDYEIEAVYGSDTVDKKSGTIMEVNTLFPSKSEGGQVKGGVILLKLEKKNKNNDGELELKVTYKDRNGTRHANEQVVEIKDDGEERYDNTGIRKAIMLTRYANTLKNWILYERSEERKFLIRPEIGICNCVIREPQEVYELLGEWERTSVDLTVSEEYKEIFRDLKDYMEEEMEVLKDDDLEQEIDVLKELIKHKNKLIKIEKPVIRPIEEPIDIWY